MKGNVSAINRIIMLERASLVLTTEQTVQASDSILTGSGKAIQTTLEQLAGMEKANFIMHNTRPQ